MILLQLASLALSVSTGVTFPVAAVSADVPPSVVVVSFELVDNRIYFPAEVAGHRGHVFLDTGANASLLNPRHLQAAATGSGLDTVTEHDSVTDPAIPIVWTEVAVRVGTATVRMRPSMNQIAVAFGSSHWFSGIETYTKHPALGILGVPFMEQFETVIDYSKRRLVFIPLDSTGHRLVAVPEYTPATTMHMWVGKPDLGNWYVNVQLGGLADSVMLDTGGLYNELNAAGLALVGSHVTPAGTDSEHGFPLVKLDRLNFGGRIVKDALFAKTGSASLVLGNAFLAQQGVVGFNFRAGQFTLYH